MLALNQQLTAEQRITKAVIDITAHPRYMALAGVLMVGNKTVSDDVPTACTNGRDEIYGRAFVDSLTDAELRFLILHECYHKMYRHLITWKHLHDKNHNLANASCDYNLNGKLVDENQEDGFAAMPRDEVGKMIGLFDEQFRKPDGSWSDTALIFKMLEQQQNQPQGNESGGDDSQGTSSAQSQGQGQGQGQGFDEHDWEGADKLSDDEVKDLEKEIDVAIRQGSMIASKSGATGNRLLDELMQAKVDWREVLREFIQTTCTGNDYSTWKRPNRRYIGAGVYLPSGISEKVDELVIAIDTSGSIPDADLAVFLSEVQSICTTVKPDKVRILYWGHRVVGDESYATHELDTLTKSTKPKGGGGTDVECVVEYMQQHQIKPQATIIFTDGCLFGDWGTWDCPTLWCVIDNEHATPDNGKVVHIQSSDM
jgi:predicted metal-dependent peptidase